MRDLDSYRRDIKDALPRPAVRDINRFLIESNTENHGEVGGQTLA